MNHDRTLKQASGMPADATGTPGSPAASTWYTHTPGTGFDDPYGEASGPAWPGPGGAGDLPQPGPATSATRPWPARPAPARARQRTWRRPALALAAAVLAGAGFATGVAAVSSPPAVRIGLADNPAATPYTPSAGPAGSSAGTATPPPGTSPPATASPAPAGTPASWPPAITRTAAANVVTSFLTRNNQADKTRSAPLLARIEAGTSYAIDAGAYRTGRAADPANSRYAPLAAPGPVYWIPRLPAGTYPRWFAARLTYTAAGQPQHFIAAGYVVFAQASPGAAWKDVLEPYLLPPGSHGAFVVTDPAGYATAAPVDAAGLGVQPGQAAGQTASSLDGGASLIQDPGNLADLRDAAYFTAHLPAGTSVSDTHAGDGSVYALETAGGGVLAFFGLSAQLAITAPAGQQVTIGIPGYYTGQPVASADINYAEQFALYLPPPGQGGPVLLADASGIAG